MTLSDQHIDHLNMEFKKEEVVEAIKSMQGVSSPGPDGIPPVFYKRNGLLAAMKLQKQHLSSLREVICSKEQTKLILPLSPKWIGQIKVNSGPLVFVILPIKSLQNV